MSNKKIAYIIGTVIALSLLSGCANSSPAVESTTQALVATESSEAIEDFEMSEVSQVSEDDENLRTNTYEDSDSTEVCEESEILESTELSEEIVEKPEIIVDNDVLSSKYKWKPVDSEEAKELLHYMNKSENGKLYSSFNSIYAFDEASNNWKIACQNSAPFFGLLAFDFVSYNDETYIVSTPPSEVIASHKKGGDYDASVFYGKYDYAITSLDFSKMIVLKNGKEIITIDYNLADETITVRGSDVKGGTKNFKGAKDSEGNYTFTEN